jgi:hypothetical protein
MYKVNNKRTNLLTKKMIIKLINFKKKTTTHYNNLKIKFIIYFTKEKNILLLFDLNNEI